MHRKIKGVIFLILVVLLNCGAVYAAELNKYTNPGDIIISQPANKTKTSSSRVSILGAVDYNYPLYMNGNEIHTTENGFFAQFVDLKVGENKFIFSNNGKTKTVTITRTQSSTSTSTSTSSTPSAPKVTKYSQPSYGIVKSNYITHRAEPDDSPKLLTPLAKDTTFKLLGEVGSYYQIDGGSYVVKSVIDRIQGELNPNIITKVILSEDAGFTSLSLSMNVNALYDIELSENTAALTVFASADKSDGVSLGDTTISNIEKVSGEGTIKYNITFKENAVPVGYFVEYTEGVMNIRFRRAGVPDGGLKGMSIVLDAGHGGTDTGALGPPASKGSKEKDFNLYVALVARDYLESRGATVHMLRKSDTTLALANRVSAILDKRPNLSVSVHVNSMPITADYNQVKGPLMFYTYDIGFDAASHILQYISQEMGTEYKDPRRSNLALTRITNCPAILFEMSFMSNPDDYEWLLKEETLKGYGVALGKGIEDFLLSSE